MIKNVCVTDGIFSEVMALLIFLGKFQIAAISSFVEPPSKINDLGVFDNFDFFHCIHIEQCIL